MTELLLKSLWFILPAGGANIAPVLAARLFPHWTTSIDGGRSFRGRRILGANKTVRGFCCGVLVGGIVFTLQRLSVEHVPVLSEWAYLFVYQGFSEVPIWFGFFQGICALAGDALKSFFKRQRDLPPGASWIPFDQTDWIIATLLGSTIFVELSVTLSIAVALVAMVVSPVAHFIGYLLKLNADPL